MLIRMRPTFVKIFRIITDGRGYYNDNATNNKNIDKYDSENNSTNGESISNFDRSRLYEKISSFYYLLIDSDTLENIIDIIRKCPTERCSGKGKYYSDFQSKQSLLCKFLCTNCS